MGTTIAALRNPGVNRRLSRANGDTIPWADADVDGQIADVLSSLWPDLGVFSYDETACDGTQFIDVPVSIVNHIEYKVSRVILLDAPAASGGTYSDDVKGWRRHPVSDQVVVKSGAPAQGSYAGFYAWVPFSATGADLPTSLTAAVADRAASFAYGDLAARLANYQKQLNLDDSRVVDYPTAVGLAAYYEKRFQDGTLDSQFRLTFAPRSSSRSR